MRRIFITLGLLLSAGSPSLAEEIADWATPMFDHTSHDFGTVARGQEAEHGFPLKNIYVEDVVIEAVHSSCSCMIPRVTRNRLKMHEKGEIIAVVDTKKFLGRKETTFRVDLSCQTAQGLLRAEVQLHAYAYIRSDVVVEPGAVRFGSVPHGAGAPRQKVSISYAGQSDWKILQAEGNPYLDLELIETGRHPGPASTQVSYDLLVGLKADAPVGSLRDPVMLVTNDRDRNAARVVVSVEGDVTATISAKPSPLMLGLISPGQSVERPLVVRGQKPFRITDISGPNDRFQFEVADEAKILHVVPITFTAGDTPGTVTGEIRIQTDAPGGETLKVKYHGRIVAPDPEAPSDESPADDSPSEESPSEEPSSEESP